MLRDAGETVMYDGGTKGIFFMLVVHELSFGFRHRRLFEKLSLTVAAGELVHLSGPNGAGKSTFMSIVAGLLAPISGEVRYLPDASNQTPAPDRREYLEYLPAEANGLHLKMDATQNLLYWARLRGLELAREDAFRALEAWNLNHPLLRDDFPVEKFSTGMKRRLALARLGLSPTRGWLLDEPLYGLDVEATGAFATMLKTHLSRGGLALVISHDLKPLDGLITRTVSLGSPGRGGRK